MVVDKYCQIVERDTATISVLWKVLHLSSLFTAALCSLISIIHFDIIIAAFGSRCVLYPKLNFSLNLTYETVGELPLNISFHNAQTLWGDDWICTYATSAFLFSMVAGLILLAFFILIPKGGYTTSPTFLTSHAWKFLPPAIFVSLIMTICVSIAYCYIRNGVTVFTDQLYAHLMKEEYCTDCDEELNVFTLIYSKQEIEINDNIKALNITTTIVLVAWIVLITSLFLRLFLGVDFKIVIYNIKPGLKIPDVESSDSSESYHPDDMLPYMKKRKATETEEKQRDDDESDSDENAEMYV